MARVSAGNPERAGAAERRARVVQLRRRRVTFAEIGRLEGISEQRAWKIYQDALHAIVAPAVHEHRAEELILVDDAIRDLLSIARDHGKSPRTSVEAWNSIRGWAEHKARIVGLNAPVKVEVSDAIEAEISRLAAELAAVEPGGKTEAAGDAEARGVSAPPA
jgi:hypothetical protein